MNGHEAGEVPTLLPDNEEHTREPFSVPGMSFNPGESGGGSRPNRLNDTSSFHVGSTAAVGVDQFTEVFETAVIAVLGGIDGKTMVLEQALRNPHETGEQDSVEFLRYRWHVARLNKAIYFHDPVDALTRWGHGLFGASIAEPTGSTWHDLRTGEEILSGPLADIHVDPSYQVLPGLMGSFREFVLFMNDRNPFTGSSFNLRAEPLRADTDRGR